MSSGQWLKALAGGLLMQAAVLPTASAEAEYAFSGGCLGNGGYFSGSSNCAFTERKGPFGIARIYKVDEPTGEALEQALERDRKWLARCKPAIRQDAYGVGKYYYAASGCEFGKSDDYQDRR